MESLASRLLIPLQTVYFIVCDSIRSIQLMLYFNSPLARSFMKLVCWKAQGGFFRHISASMGHLPIPDLSIMLKILSTNTAKRRIILSKVVHCFVVLMHMRQDKMNKI